MYFELQLSAAVFSRVIRNRLRALPLGLDLSLPDERDGELVVDQVVIGDSTTVQREKVVDYSSGSALATPAATQSVTTLSPTNLGSFVVPYMQIRQEVRVLLVRAADLAKNGPKATPPALTVTVFPVFNVSLNAANQTQGGGPLTLTYALAYVDFGPIALALNDAQRAQIAQVTGGLTIASSVVDLSAMTKLMNRPVTAINAGIACDPTGTRVALRVDFDIYASPIAVDSTFFEVGPADLLGGKDWAMLMDANVIIQEAEQRIKAALAAKANLRIRSDPVGTWDAGEATLRVAADIRLLGACPGFVDDINMDVRIDLGTRFKVPTPDHLVTHYQLDSGLTDSGQVFGCALTAALLYPFAGAALLEQKKIDLTGLPRRHRVRSVLLVRATGRRDQCSETRGRHLQELGRHLPQDQRFGVRVHHDSEPGDPARAHPELTFPAGLGLWRAGGPGPVGRRPQSRGAVHRQHRRRRPTAVRVADSRRLHRQRQEQLPNRQRGERARAVYATGKSSSRRGCCRIHRTATRSRSTTTRSRSLRATRRCRTTARCG